MKKKSRFLILGVIVFIISCVTVNIYFPAAEVQKAADVIVEDVRQLDKKQEQKPHNTCFLQKKRFHGTLTAPW